MAWPVDESGEKLGLPTLVYIAHKADLADPEEWFWTDDAEEAFVFGSSDQAKPVIQAQGGWLLWGPIHRVVRHDPPFRRTRRVSPEEAYAALESRHLD